MTEAELEKIMDEYSDLVYTVAASILGRERAPDIEECMSDTFFDIFRSSYEADQIGRNYVITIARRRAVDRLRYIGRHGGSRDEELNEELAEAGFSDDIAETTTKSCWQMRSDLCRIKTARYSQEDIITVRASGK